jgi:hypothetical protein
VGRTLSAAEAIPLPLEASGPVGKELRFVDEYDGASLAYRGLLSSNPEPLPEAGRRRLGPIGSRVDRPLSLALLKIEEEGGLSHLPWTGEELDPAGSGLRQSPGEEPSAITVVQPVLIYRHSRIIIRL